MITNQCSHWIAFLNRAFDGDQSRIAEFQRRAGLLLAESSSDSTKPVNAPVQNPGLFAAKLVKLRIGDFLRKLFGRKQGDN